MAGPVNVFLADDQEDLRDALAILLQSAGHHLVPRDDGLLVKRGWLFRTR